MHAYTQFCHYKPVTAPVEAAAAEATSRNDSDCDVATLADAV